MSPPQSLQLIDERGVLHEARLNSFVEEIRLASLSLQYTVVAIMGPQSSGKSTLLNQLFKTHFEVMDASGGRGKTTRGVWLGCAEGMERTTIVMDIEGTDGKERKDDLAFEKRSALLALTVSDTLLINMWEKDVGLNSAANRPLLTIIFEVMMRLFPPRKTTLLFVLRDREEKTPLKIIHNYLLKDVQEIWESAVSAVKTSKQLTDFFTVQLIRLPHYSHKLDLFEKEVSDVQKRFENSNGPGGLAGYRMGVKDGSFFGRTICRTWGLIQECETLDLPAIEVLTATYRCRQIVDKKLSDLSADTEWIDLDKKAEKGSVPDFGKQLSAILDRQLKAYDDEAEHFNGGVKKEYRDDLLNKMLDTVRPAYQAVISNLRKEMWKKFELEIGKFAERPAENPEFMSDVDKCSDDAVADFDSRCKDVEIDQAAEKKEFQSIRSGEHDKLQADVKARSLKIVEDYSKKVLIWTKVKATLAGAAGPAASIAGAIAGAVAQALV